MTGYRAQLNPRLSLDTTIFLNFYRHLVSNEQGAPYVAYGPAGPQLTIPLNYANLARASDYGFEVFANWQVTRNWKISPGYSALRLFVARDEGGTDTTITDIPGDSPKQQFEVRSALNLGKRIEWDSSLKYVAAINVQTIPAYVRLDTRIGWRMGEFMELSVTGQNLAGGPRFEFLDDTGLFGPAEVARSIFAKLTWRSQ